MVVMWGMEGCLVKVGGVDTEMYRTGHSHACSINLTTFCCSSCCGAHREQRGALRLGDHVKSGRGFFTLISDRRAPFLFGKKKPKKKNPEWCHSLSLSKVGFHRTVKTPLIYHELFGCYVPSLWTLRTVRTDCSSVYQ